MKGSIRKSGENRWRLVFDLDRGLDGKRRQKVKRFNGNRKAAEAKLRELMSEYENGGWVEPAKLTTGECLERWLIGHKPSVAAKTAERYDRIVKKGINPILGAIPLQRLQASDIQSAYAEMLV